MRFGTIANVPHQRRSPRYRSYGISCADRIAIIPGLESPQASVEDDQEVSRQLDWSRIHTLTPVQFTQGFQGLHHRPWIIGPRVLEVQNRIPSTRRACKTETRRSLLMRIGAESRCVAATLSRVSARTRRIWIALCPQHGEYRSGRLGYGANEENLNVDAPQPPSSRFVLDIGTHVLAPSSRRRLSLS